MKVAREDRGQKPYHIGGNDTEWEEQKATKYLRPSIRQLNTKILVIQDRCGLLTENIAYTTYGLNIEKIRC